MEQLKKTNENIFVLLGGQGVGKTTLYNKICRQNFPSGFSERSLTRGLFKHTACYGNIPFELIDTPASDSEIEPVKHAIHIKNALTVLPLNIIFILVEYQSRVEKALSEFKQNFHPFKKFQHKIIVLISKFDQCKYNSVQQEKIKQYYRDNFKKQQMIENIIFVSEQDDATNISNMMTKYLNAPQFKREQLEYTVDDQSYLEQFKKATKQQLEAYNKIEKEINDIIDDYLALILENQNDPDKDWIIFSVIQYCEIDLRQLVNEFVQKFQEYMNELLYYEFYVRLQTQVIQKLNDLRKKGYSFLSYDPNDPNDPINMFKRCPNPECNIMWVRVEGCDGATTCGNRPQEQKNDLFQGSYCFYSFRRIGRKFQKVKRSIKEKSTIDQKIYSTDKKVGCGTTMVWSQLPRISDKDIQELEQVVSIDKIINAFAKDLNIYTGFNDDRNINNNYMGSTSQNY